MDYFNPFEDDKLAEAEDKALITRAQAGDKKALEQLITRHQAWIYNIVLRMVYFPADAEDITQEILIKLLTKLSTFEQRSSFRTWLYRIAINHLLNMQRSRAEQKEFTFTEYGQGLNETPDAELPDPHAVPVDVQLLVDEARIGCTSGMLLCLDRDQRMVYILGAILGVADVTGAELLDVSRANFRQKLARARRDLHSFMHNQCGLINRENPCRCSKKTQGFIRSGYLDPQKLLFAAARITAVRLIAKQRADVIDDLDAAYGEIQRAHPFHDSPDYVAALRNLLDHTDFKQALDPNN